MTFRLYYTDSYLTEFDARVLERAEDEHRIYLDRTAFYPTSGGQPHDTGTLDGVPVVDVIDEGDRIAHVLASPLSNEHVRGAIDWTRRYDHMQQHTGQHVLSAVFDDLFGYGTVSVHFGDAVSTLDLDVASLEAEQVIAAETRANEVVVTNKPVGVFFENADAVTGLRKPPPERKAVVRVVEVSGVDRSACGGTHVRSTAEIGPILLRKLDRVRKSTRVEFVCGARAVRRARADFEALEGIARALSASFDDAAALVAGQSDKLAAADRSNRKLSADLLAYRARELHTLAAVAPDGLRRAVLHVARGEDAGDVRTLAQEFSRLTRAVLVVTTEEPAGVVLAATEDSGADASALLREALARVGGRGGGSPRVAQGRVLDRKQLAEVLAALEELPSLPQGS